MADHAEAARKPRTAATDATGTGARHAVGQRRALGETAAQLNGSAPVVAQRALAARLSAPAQRAEAPPPPNRTGLPDQLKSGIESLSGIAMDDVRVHRNSSAPSQLQAHAFAQGSDIHLAPGQDHHLPHEAWHVVQQKQGRVKATMQMKAGQMKGTAINDDSALEHEADHMGAKAMHAAPAQRAAAPRRVVAAPAQRVAQLGKPKLNLRKNAKSRNGTFSGVSFKNFKRPSSNSRKQGQHGTAYVAFQQMMVAHIIDRTPTDAIQSLEGLIPKIRAMLNPRTSKPYLFASLNSALTQLNNARGQLGVNDRLAIGNIEDAIGTILTVRNQLPGTSTVTTNTGGHGESSSSGKLAEVEKCLRDKEHFPAKWGSEAAVAKEAAFSMWRLLDMNPYRNKGNTIIADKLVRHSKQMAISYPHTYTFLGTKSTWFLRTRVGSQEKGMPLKNFTGKDIARIKKMMADEGY